MSTSLIKPFIFERPDKCPICKKDRVIDIYSGKYENPINYSIMIDRNSINRDRLFDIRYMKCKYCGKKFLPTWIGDKLYPMEDSDMENFMKLYKSNTDK